MPSAGLLLAAPLGALLSSAAAQPVLQQDVAYTIDVRLNAKEHLLTGRSRIVYTNRSPDALAEMVIHLYPNTFRDRFSTAAREQTFYHEETFRRIPAAERGYLDVEQLRADGESVPFQVVDTLLRLQLPRPLLPGGTVTLDLDWIGKVRRHLARGGYRGRHYELRHWYPEVAVYGPRGWHAEQAHDVGDVYGELASFDVSLTVPRDYVVAATGVLVAGDAGWEGAKVRAQLEPGPETSVREDRGEPVEIGAGGSRKTLRFRAERVHDFAWVADPAFLCEEGSAGGVAVRVLYRPGERDAWRTRVLERALEGIRWLEENFGRHPYPQITIAGTYEGQGGEHPMLLLLGGALDRELAHGLARLWFGSALGSDPVHAAWLDEGLGAWAARRYLTGRYGPPGESPEDLGVYRRHLPRTSARDRAQHEVLRSARYGMDEPVATVSHLFRDKANYRPMVESKASLFVEMLRHTIGADAFGHALRHYVELGQIAHVEPGTLELLLEAASARELRPLFHDWLETTRSGDYALGRVRSRPSGSGYDVEVEVRRKGTLATPIDLLVRAEDGTEQRVRWDGEARQATLHATLTAPPSLVVLDPDAIVIDRNRLDNRKPFPAELQFDWPLMDYAPRDAYLVRYRPTLWPNLVDGLRGGMVFSGSQDGLLHRLRFAPSLGVKEPRFDFLASYATRLTFLGRSEVEGEVLKAEGRRRIRALLRMNLSRRLERKPQTHVEAGFQSFAATDAAYFRPNRFGTGRTNQFSFRYGGDYAGPGYETEAWLRYQVAGPQLDSDFAFQRVSMALTLRTTRPRTQLRVRGFLGLSSDGDVLPREERFYLGGAGPLAELDSAALRSRDSILTYFNYHLPGDGNFRAYNGSPVSARRLFTINLEAERPVLGRDRTARSERFERRYGRLSLAAFGDIGKAEGTGVPDLSNPLFGVGLGVRWRRKVLGRDFLVRLDFPFYANRPGFDEDGVREERSESRWLLSFSPSF